MRQVLDIVQGVVIDHLSPTSQQGVRKCKQNFDMLPDAGFSFWQKRHNKPAACTSPDTTNELTPRCLSNVPKVFRHFSDCSQSQKKAARGSGHGGLSIVQHAAVDDGRLLLRRVFWRALSRAQRTGPSRRDRGMWHRDVWDVGVMSKTNMG